MKRITCSHDRRLIPVVPDLWLSECCSYGRLANMKGAVDEARVLAEKAGGIVAMRDKIEQQERDRKLELAQAREDVARVLKNSIRKDSR